MSEDALRVARENARDMDPVAAAACAGAAFVPAQDGASDGRFEFDFIGSDAVVTWPALEPAIRNAPPLPPHVGALLVYYLGRSCDAEPTGSWVSFAQLPEGGVYVQAFRGYTTGTLLRRFAESPEALHESAGLLGAQPLPGFADRAWRFDALPKVPVALLWWDADDEFPARAELLFDETACRYLPIDGCAVLGSWLTAALIRGAR